MQNANKQTLEQQFPPSSPKRPNEQGGIAVTESLLIFDPKTAEKLVEKDRNAY
jgi:hypothetical protein